MGKWYIENGPESDVVMSSRVRLARNLKEYPFPSRMTKQQSDEIIEIAKRTLSKDIIGTDFEFYGINNISEIDKEVLVERHLISPNFLNSKNDSGVFLGDDEKLSIMVNEEDHFRIQSMNSGLQIKKCWENLNKVENYIEERLDFAFNSRYGYLTTCPTNLGTGIRVSVMLHLPALVMTGYMGKILEGCSKIGFTVRGLYGENSETTGNIFQVSNQVTLGISDEEIVENTISVAKQVIQNERNLRESLYKNNTLELEDKIFRSYGVVSNSRVISSEESLKLLSNVRLGVDLGIIKNVNREVLNEITLNIKPASLQKVLGSALEYNERDVMRAKYIRERINKN